MKDFIVMSIRVAALSILAFGAFATGGQTTFIPYSPPSPEEMAALKKGWQGMGLKQATIDEELNNVRKHHVYRESDIVAAFPELRRDLKRSVCSNSIMQGATQIVYLSHPSNNEVTIKTASCSAVDKGLSCQPIKRERQYFLDTPWHPFSLEGLALPDARTILEAYDARRIDPVPDFFNGHPRVRAIKALREGGYRLFFGDYFCSGCAMSFNVRLDARDGRSWLGYAGDPQADCF